MRKLNARQLAREKSVFRYSSALERGDFDTVTQVLQEAERDPALAQMISEMNAVFESETLRLSPSLNHSTNHRQKELLMTTIVLPARQRNMQRWLPFTIAAACVSALFIGALLMRPPRSNTFQAGVKVTMTPTAAASPTPIPTGTPLAVSGAGGATSPLQPTVVPPDAQITSSCVSQLIITQDSTLYANPSTAETVIGTLASDSVVDVNATSISTNPTDTVPQAWFYITGTIKDKSVKGWVQAENTKPSDTAQGCAVGVTSVGSGESMPNTVELAVQLALQTSGISCDSQDAVIISPSNNAIVTGTLDVMGIATAPNFGSYQIEIIGVGTGGNYVHLMDGTQPITSIGELGQIDLSAYPPNNYGLRLNVFDSANQVQARCLVNITLARSTTAIASAGGSSSVTGTKAIVGAEQTVLRDTPQADGRMIRMLYHNTTFIMNESSPDGLWVHITLPDGIQGWILASDVQTEGIPQEAQPALLCWGMTGAQTTPIYSRPAYAGSSVVIDTLAAQAKVLIFDVDDQAGNAVGWYYVQGESNGRTVQGWIQGDAFVERAYCPQTSSPRDQFTVVVTTPVPVLTAPDVTVTATPIPVVTGMVATADGICHIINLQSDSIKVFSGPSWKADEAVLVNNLPPNTPATVLYQQTNKQTGDLWYLVLVVMDQDKQISGWVSANDVTVMDACPPPTP